MILAMLKMVRNVRQNLGNLKEKKKRAVDEAVAEQAVPCNDSPEVGRHDIPTTEASNIRDGSYVSANDRHNPNNVYSFCNMPNGLHREDGLKNMEFPESVIFKFIGTVALSVAKVLVKG